MKKLALIISGLKASGMYPPMPIATFGYVDFKLYMKKVMYVQKLILHG